MNLIQEYLECFKKHYPQRIVEVKRCRGGYHVLIDGKSDEYVMTDDDFRFAIRNFKR